MRLRSKLFLVAALAALLACMSVTSTRAAAEDPAKAPDKAAGKAADKPNGNAPAKAPPKADKPDEKVFLRNRQRDLLSTDFMLTDPKGAAPKGITEAENALIQETLRAGCEHFIAYMKESGPPEAHGLLHGIAVQAALIWALLGCGYPVDDPGAQAALTELLKPAAAVPPAKGASPRSPIEELETDELGLALTALWMLAEAREREAGGPPPGAQPDEKDAAKKDDAPKTSSEFRKRAKALGTRLTSDEAMFAARLREAILVRQDLHPERRTDKSRLIAAGGWYTSANPSIHMGPKCVLHALMGLMSAYRLGLEVPPMESLEGAVNFLINTQQRNGVGVPLAYASPKALEARDPKRAAPPPRIVRVTARGWNDCIFADDTGRAMERTQRGDFARPGETGCAVSALLIARWLAAGGIIPSATSPLVAKTTEAVQTGQAWLVRCADCRSPGAAVPRTPGEDMGGNFPGSEYGTEFEGDLGAVMMCVLTGSEALGVCQWYPDTASYWTKKLDWLRKQGRVERGEKAGADKAADDKRVAELPEERRGGGPGPGGSHGEGMVGIPDLLVLMSAFDKVPGGVESVRQICPKPAAAPQAADAGKQSGNAVNGPAGDDPAKPVAAQPVLDRAGNVLLLRNRQRDLVSTDFMLTHPKGAAPEGITDDERNLIAETLRAGCAKLIAYQKEYGAQQLGTMDKVSAQSVILWVLLGCGYPVADPAVQVVLAEILKSAVPVRGAAQANPAAGLQTDDAGLALVALWQLAEARDREAAAKDAAARAGDKDTAKKAGPAKPTDDLRRRAKTLGSRLTPEEAALAANLRDTIISRQDLHPERRADAFRFVPRGGWDDTAVPSGSSEPALVFYALLGLMSAYRVGLDAPPQECLEGAVNFLTAVQQQTGLDMPLAYMSPKVLDAKDAKNAKRSVRPARANACGWDNSLSISANSSSTPPKDGLIEFAEVGQTGCGVAALVIVRWLAANGAVAAASNPLAAKTEKAIQSGQAWLVRCAECESQGAAVPRKPGEPMGGNFPGDIHGVEFEGDLGTVMMCLLTGTEALGVCEWYPVAARFWVEKLTWLRREARAAAKAQEAGGKPVGGKPAAEKPGAEKPAGEKSAGEKPAGEKPEGDKSANGKPGAEMRLEEGGGGPGRGGFGDLSGSVFPGHLLILMSAFDKTPGGIDSLQQIYQKPVVAPPNPGENKPPEAGKGPEGGKPPENPADKPSGTDEKTPVPDKPTSGGKQ
jgi:hypothetical protein